MVKQTESTRQISVYIMVKYVLKVITVKRVHLQLLHVPLVPTIQTMVQVPSLNVFYVQKTPLMTRQVKVDAELVELLLQL